MLDLIVWVFLWSEERCLYQIGSCYQTEKRAVEIKRTAVETTAVEMTLL